MTKEDILRMAQEAGMQTVFAVIEEHEDGTQTVIDHRPFLERFASLVQAAEREACAKLCEKAAYWDNNSCATAIRARGDKHD